MIGQTLSHYRILGRLGGGGMGVVYKAEDTRLRRTVALKFLPPELTRDAGAKERFVREAQAASALDHPNICTIHEIDETAEGQLFIAMACYEGETLKQKIERGPLAIEESIEMALQVAQGLERAHEAGIVHRDVKPANVMVTSRGEVKIVDFGLAKVADVSLTRTGTTVGTTAYMSPEQARGEKVDQRTDLWSLGVVLYEMLTGERPFRGAYEQAVLYAILHEEPVPVRSLRPGVPETLEDVVKRCLSKSPDQRYQRMHELLADLRRISRKTRTTALVRAEIRGPLSSNRGRLLAGSMTAVLLLVGIGWYFGGRSEGAVTQVAARADTRVVIVVLPFQNLGPRGDDYFADGVTGEITSRLASVRNLGVISPMSAVKYKNTDKSVQQIAEELGAEYVLEGTVQWDRSASGPDRVRVIPTLSRALDETQVWSTRYNRVLEDIFAVQSDLAEQVVQQMNITLLEPERLALTSKPTEDLEAWQAYLRGLDHMNRAGRSAEEMELARQMFSRAIALDPNFALAYADLSRVYSRLYHSSQLETYLKNAREAVDRALELDPNLSEAHLALGYYYYWGQKAYGRALEAFSRAEERLPNDSRILEAVAFIQRRQGNFDAAIEKLKEAFVLNPREARLAFEIGHSYMATRRYAEAEYSFDRAIGLTPDHVLSYLLKVYSYWLWKGAPEQTRATLESTPQSRDENLTFFWFWQELLERKHQAALDRLASTPDTAVFVFQDWITPKSLLSGLAYSLMDEPVRARASYEVALRLLERQLAERPEDHRLHSALGLAFAGLGRREEAIRAGKRAVELHPIEQDALAGSRPIEHLARIYALLGNHQAALDQIEYLLSKPSYLSTSLLRIDPRWDLLRTQPRFQKMLGDGA